MSSLRTNSNVVNRLCKAYGCASERNAESLEFLCDFLRVEGTTPVGQPGNTVLHFLAIHGNVDAFNALIRNDLPTNDQLRKPNDRGDTALHEAARSGQTEVVKIMVRKAPDLVSLRNEFGETPLCVAAASGRMKVFKFLEGHSNCMTRRRDGRTVLHAAIMGQYYRLAIYILESYPDLARKRDQHGMSALNFLAERPNAFRSGSTFSPRNLGFTSFLPLQIVAAIIYFCTPLMYGEPKSAGNEENPCPRNGVIILKPRSSLCERILGLSLFKEIDDEKQQNFLAMVLAKRLIMEEKDWSGNILCENTDFEISWPEIPSKKKNRERNPLIQAATHGIVELVKEILHVYPNSVNSLDDKRRNILHILAESKSILLYDYFKDKIPDNLESKMKADVDEDGNTILHLAANETMPRFSVGVVQQMSWEVFWFKHIKYDSYPLVCIPNIAGKIPEKLFEENHKAMREQAKKEIKEANNGLMVVATLTGTVSFAALFTIPGGFDQTKGSPVLFNPKNHHQQDLWWFLTYVGGTLFASLFALGTLISIQLSRFEINDFHIALPVKLLMATTALFYSASYLFAACLQAYVLDNLLECGSMIPIFFSVLLMTLAFIDIAYMPVSYMYYVFRYSLTYKRK